jgi:hypothetical protein
MIDQTEISIPMHSYEGAMSFIYNTKIEYPHLRMAYHVDFAGVIVKDFKSDVELTMFLIKCDSFRGIYG